VTSYVRPCREHHAQPISSKLLLDRLDV
jgi:hypothetical protein